MSIYVSNKKKIEHNTLNECKIDSKKVKNMTREISYV